MQSQRPFRLLTILLPALLPVLLAGCLTDDKADPGGKIRPRPGLSMEVLTAPKSAKLVDGKLCVANRDRDFPGIAVVDLATETILAYHDEALLPNELAAVGDSLLIVSEAEYNSDFSVTGAMSLLNVKSGAWDPSYKTVNSDNVLSSSGDMVFLMERQLGVVTGFTNGRLAAENVFFNVQTGAGSNPYQTAIHGKQAFITRYDLPSLLVLEADKLDGGARDSIDLSVYVASSLKDTVGAVPRMDAAVVYGDHLFVTVQRLEKNYSTADTSKVLVIDVASHAVVAEIPLQRRNPIAVETRGKWLFVTCVQTYGVFDGAVERIDMESRRSGGLIVEEANLLPPANLSQFVPASDDKGYAISTADFVTSTLKAYPIPAPAP